MTHLDILEFVPEDKRSEAKAALDGLVKLDNREAAEKAIKDLPALRSALDAEISRAVESHDRKFREEKLPGLVEEEVRRKNPPKDPRDQELEKVRSEVETLKKTAARERQTVRAIQKATELGLPQALAARMVGEDDETTDRALSELAAQLTPWRDAAVQAVRTELAGNRGKPEAGRPAGKSLTRADFEALPPAAKLAAVRDGTTITD